MKHNKKRNTAFLYECLIKELTKASGVWSLCSQRSAVADGTWAGVSKTAVSADILLVAGGGGGGGPTSFDVGFGGGGAGGLILQPNSLALTTGPNTITIGGGGAKRTTGEDSTINFLIAKGGGR